jgi:hypothetical protein
MYLPLPRLHVPETLQLPHLTLLPAVCDAERADAPLTKRQKDLKTAVGLASEAAYICFPDETLVFRDGAEENNLAEAFAGMSGVTENDFRQHTLLEMPFESPSFELWQPTRKNDQKVIAAALEHADAAVDGIRFNYCRLDVPQMSLGPAGYLPDKNMFAVYFHDADQNQGRLIVHELANPISMPGLGLDLDAVEPSPVDPLICNTYRPGTLGVRLQRLLRMYCQSFTAPSDEVKILGNVFAMDGCLTPDNSRSSDFKKFVAMAYSGSPSGYRLQLDKFGQFYREVRNPLVHDGRSYAQLGRDRRLDLFYLQGLLHLVLENLTKSANEDFDTYWQSTISLANQHT